MQQQGLVIVTLAFFIGTVFGSFVSMASCRLPRALSWNGRSRCPGCNAPIDPKYMVPIVSWLLSRGKSACCGQKISMRYPATEFLSGICFALAAWRFGLGVELFFTAFLAVLLMMIAVIDLEHQIIPDSLNAVLALSGIGWQWQSGGNLILAFLAGFLLGGIGYLTAWFTEKALKKEALGGGDIKFLAAAGLWCGFWYVPHLLILGGVSGIVIGVIWKRVKKESIFPFGPALCLAVFTIVLFSKAMALP